MKQMKEQVSSLFFHHCVTGDKQQQGMRPVIMLHFLLLLLVIISLCRSIYVFFSLGMAIVLFLMLNHFTNGEIFGKHFNYGMGIPVIIMCIEEENHWFSILKHSQQSFWDIFCWSQTCDWKRPLSLSSSVACRSKIVTEVASIWGKGAVDKCHTNNAGMWTATVPYLFNSGNCNCTFSL